MPNTKSVREFRDVSDSPELTKEDFAKMRAFAETVPELAVSARKGRGPNKAPCSERTLWQYVCELFSLNKSQ